MTTNFLPMHRPHYLLLMLLCISQLCLGEKTKVLMVGGLLESWRVWRQDMVPGPHEVTRYDDYYDLSGVLDESDPRLLVIYPKVIDDDKNNETFPLLSFAHGLEGGGDLLHGNYRFLLRDVASYGFIVAATLTCSVDCIDRLYVDQLAVVDWAWAKIHDPVFRFVDRAVQAGLFGHSFGGRATALAMGENHARVGAGVALHAVPRDLEEGSNTLRSITKPMAAFTGKRDTCCSLEPAQEIYDLSDPPKALASRTVGFHIQPETDVFSKWPRFVAAWFHVHLSGEHDDDDRNNGKTSYDTIYGEGPDTLCNDDFLSYLMRPFSRVVMTKCEVPLE